MRQAGNNKALYVLGKEGARKLWGRNPPPSGRGVSETEGTGRGVRVSSDGGRWGGDFDKAPNWVPSGRGRRKIDIDCMAREMQKELGKKIYMDARVVPIANASLYCGSWGRRRDEGGRVDTRRMAGRGVCAWARRRRGRHDDPGRSEPPEIRPDLAFEARGRELCLASLAAFPAEAMFSRHSSSWPPRAAIVSPLAPRGGRSSLHRKRGAHLPRGHSRRFLTCPSYPL